MTVEQTSQLIQLVLNSVLMTAACGVVLAALLIRYAAIQAQMQSITQEYFEARSQAGDRASGAKSQLHQWRQHYRSAQFSLFVTQLSFFTLLVSTFFLSLRALLDWNWLITTSLVFFNAGIIIFLGAIVLLLLELRSSKAFLWKEMGQLLNLHNRTKARPAVSLQKQLPAARSRTSKAIAPQPRKIGIG